MNEEIKHSLLIRERRSQERVSRFLYQVLKLDVFTMRFEQEQIA